MRQRNDQRRRCELEYLTSPSDTYSIPSKFAHQQGTRQCYGSDSVNPFDTEKPGQVMLIRKRPSAVLIVVAV